jgi:hypothetical protein
MTPLLRSSAITAFSALLRATPSLGGAPTFALANEVFGRRDSPVVVSWIFAGHRVGGALAALGAGAVRSVTGQYFPAIVACGLACWHLSSCCAFHGLTARRQWPSDDEDCPSAKTLGVIDGWRH